ncbi:nitrogen fixation protein NifZ [Psychromonas sp. MME2]|uniref:nitrogen fixation protein NifZ n=1 Tax=unclassified Psychromonas TaxID=2614957 RepID=UPI00339D1376
MQAKFDYGDKVRVIRNIRNDGTFMGSDRGTLLIRRGSVGYIKGVGKFLQDQVIYQVHFMEQGVSVGCRESELADVKAPWSERLFERGDSIISLKSLTSKGEVVVMAGDSGTVIGLDSEQKPLQYRVSFRRANGLETNTWLIPETVLQLSENDSVVTQTLMMESKSCAPM